MDIKINNKVSSIDIHYGGRVINGIKPDNILKVIEKYAICSIGYGYTIFSSSLFKDIGNDIILHYENGYVQSLKDLYNVSKLVDSGKEYIVIDIRIGELYVMVHTYEFAGEKYENLVICTFEGAGRYKDIWGLKLHVNK